MTSSSVPTRHCCPNAAPSWVCTWLDSNTSGNQPASCHSRCHKRREPPQEDPRASARTTCLSVQRFSPFLSAAGSLFCVGSAAGSADALAWASNTSLLMVATSPTVLSLLGAASVSSCRMAASVAAAPGCPQATSQCVHSRCFETSEIFFMEPELFGLSLEGNRAIGQVHGSHSSLKKT